MKFLKSISQNENLTVGMTFLALNFIYGWSFWFLGFIGFIFLVQQCNKTKISKEQD